MDDLRAQHIYCIDSGVTCSYRRTTPPVSSYASVELAVNSEIAEKFEDRSSRVAFAVSTCVSCVFRNPDPSFALSS